MYRDVSRCVARCKCKVLTAMCTCKVLTAMAQLEEQLATARVAEAEKRKKEASGASQRIVVKFTAIRL